METNNTPGSSEHIIEALKHFRENDFSYTVPENSEDPALQNIAKNINELGEHFRYRETSQSFIEKQSRQIIDSIEDYAIFMISVDAIVQGWNKGAENIVGIKEADAIGQNIANFYTQQDIRKNEPYASMRLAKMNGRHETQTKGRRPDGSLFWANVTYTPLYNSNNSLKGYSIIARDITRMKIAEDQLKESVEKLKESELRFKLVVDSVKDYAIFMISPQGIVNGWNKGAELIKGYAAGEIIGQSISLFYTDADNEKGEPMRNLEIARRRGSYESEGWRVKKDGSLFWANVTYTPLYDDNKELKGFSKITRDMTERRKTDEELNLLSAAMAARSEILQGIANLNNIIKGEKETSELAEVIVSFICTTLKAQVGALYITSAENQLKYAAGYSFDSARDVQNIAFGQGLPGQVAKTQQSITFSDVPEGYMTVSSAFGAINPRTIYVFPFVFEGKTLGVIELGFLTDFTDEKKEFLSLVSENIGAVFYSASSREATRKLMGEISEKSELLEYQKEQLQERNEELKLKTEELLASEEELRGQQEELMQTNALMEEKAQKLEEHTEALAIKNNELEIARTVMMEKTEQLEESSRYKSEFLANMSHELRTPLNSIILLSKLLAEREGQQLTGKLAEYAKVIRKSGTDLLGLINDILDLSKIEAGKMELDRRQVPVTDMLSDMRDLFEPVAAAKDIYLKTWVEKGLPAFVFIDKVRVNQILKNLISNAIKFTEKGGVSLRIYQPENDASIIQRFNKPGNQLICFEVEDTGIGISKDKAEHIFAAFNQADGTTSRKYGGTGLGLSISRELANLMEGEVHLNSEAGKGSSFTFILPLLDVAAPTRQPQQVAKAAPQPATISQDEKPERTKLILIIEDDLQMASALAKQVENRGFRSIVTETAEEGFAEMHDEKPAGILLDIHLPGMNGWELLRKIKDNPELAHIPVHVMSGFSQDPSGEQKTLADGIIQKPATLETLDRFYQSIEAISIEQQHTILLAAAPQKEQAILPVLNKLSASKTVVADPEKILEHLLAEEYDLLILDYDLLGSETVKTAKRINDNPEWKKMRILVLCNADLQPAENKALTELNVIIIVASGKFEQRVIDEAALFLNALDKGSIDQYAQLEVKTRTENLSGKTVLIADDDSRNIFSLSESLAATSINILTAGNGRQAIDQIIAHPEINIVLMDIMMPEIDGYEAIEKIRKELGKTELPIIALTAKAMKADAERAIAAGANDYHSKPVEIEKLIQLMQVMLNRQ